MEHLPAAVLRIIFSVLSFRDIKNCRLVSRQWRQHAFDNVNFGLFIKNLGPTTRPWKKRLTSPAETVNLDRYRFRLVPFSAKANATTLRDIWAGVEVGESQEKLFFHQLDGSINHIKHKIKKITLFMPGIERLRPVLQGFIANFPSNDFSCQSSAGMSGGIAFRFESDNNCVGLVSESSMKLRTLDFQATKITEQNASVICQLLQQSATIQTLTTKEVSCLQAMLDEYKRRNDVSPVFAQCARLTLNWKWDNSQAAVAPFNKISQYFPNVEELKVSIKRHGDEQILISDLVQRLEQMEKLKHLTINSWGRPQLPRLRLPSLEYLNAFGCLLPADPREFDSTSLRHLLTEGSGNMYRLALHANDGARNLKNLQSLDVSYLVPSMGYEFLQSILTAANGLQRLELIADEANFTIMTEVCRIVAATAPNLATLTLGRVWIPVEASSLQLVEQLVGWHRTIGLKTTLIIQCMFRPQTSMANDLLNLFGQSNAINVDATNVALSTVATRVYEMAWTNAASGAQQKLRIHHVDNPSAYWTS